MKVDRNIRSRNGSRPSLVTIINRTLRSINIIWVNTSGQLITYATILPGARTPMNTFTGHAWVFCDSVTGEPMHVDNEAVLWPPPVAAITAQGCTRHEILVHLPMRSLKDILLWSILEQIDHIDKLNQLELPASLQLDLNEMFAQRPSTAS